MSLRLQEVGHQRGRPGVEGWCWSFESPRLPGPVGGTSCTGGSQ